MLILPKSRWTDFAVDDLAILGSVANIERDILNFDIIRIEWYVGCVDNASAYSELFGEFKLNGSYKSADYNSAVITISSGGEYHNGGGDKLYLSYGNYGTPEENKGHIEIDNRSGVNKKWEGLFTTNATNGVGSGHCSGSYDGADSTNQLDTFRLSATTNINSGKVLYSGRNI